MAEAVGKGFCMGETDPGGFCQVVLGSNPGVNSTSLPAVCSRDPGAGATSQLSLGKGSTEPPEPGLGALATGQGTPPGLGGLGERR